MRGEGGVSEASSQCAAPSLGTALGPSVLVAWVIPNESLRALPPLKMEDADTRVESRYNMQGEGFCWVVRDRSECAGRRQSGYERLLRLFGLPTVQLSLERQ